MLSRLRRFLKSVMEDDWAEVWHASERKGARADDATVQKAKASRDKAAAPHAEDGAEADKGVQAKDRG